MKGDTIGSTDLHLVCGDRLLVGAVHADMEINEYSGRKGVFNHTLQVCQLTGYYGYTRIIIGPCHDEACLHGF